MDGPKALASRVQGLGHAALAQLRLEGPHVARHFKVAQVCSSHGLGFRV